MSWLSDEDAARLWGARYRSGWGGIEEQQYDLEVIAYLGPAEADTCLRWLRTEPCPEPDWRYQFGDGRQVDWPGFLEYLSEIVRTGRRIHELAAATADERRRQEQRLRDLPPDDPQWHETAWVVLLAEARVDPHHAAELALELWTHRGASNPRGEQEIARRLWLQDPDAALSYLDRQPVRHCAGMLPILLQRVLTEPTADNRRLAQELLARLNWGSWAGLCIAVVRVLGTVNLWEPPDRGALLEATIQAIAQFEAADDWTRSRHAALKTEVAAHLSTLPNSASDAAALAELING